MSPMLVNNSPITLLLSLVTRIKIFRLVTFNPITPVAFLSRNVVRLQIPVQYQIQTGQVMMTMPNVVQAPLQQQPVVSDIVPPPYPGPGATAPAANATNDNDTYGEDDCFSVATVFLTV